MIEAWGRGFEKIREACVLYDGPLPEYEINEAGIMVLCKACDKYLGLLRDDGQHPDHHPNHILTNVVRINTKDWRRAMYKFPDISRWFDIVDYVEYNNCRKIEINMKKLLHTEIIFI